MHNLGLMDNLIADFDGDGKKDILSNAHYPDADHVLLERFNQFNYKLNKIKYSDKHSYEFTYAPLTQCASYQRTNFDYNKNGKAISIKPAMYVVESMKINNSLLDKTSNYYYKDLLYHKHGRGLLGFAKTAVTISNVDPNKITTIVNNYRQNILPNYVYKLDLFETITYRTNDGTGWGGIDETSRKIFTYRIINTTKFNSNVFFEYNSFLVETNNVNGTRKVTCFEYDTDGNLTYTLETYDMMGNMGNPVFTKTSNYQYATYNSWLPSSMIKSRVCQIRYNGSAPYYAQNEMGYNMMGDLTHTEHLKNNLKYYYKELFGYDNYGNIVKSSLDSANNASTNTFRTKLFEYDNGRFLKKTYNALGHISQFVYEPIYGNKISETGIDGLSTTYQYDVWGRLIQTNNPNNTQENISYDWSTNNGHNEYYSITNSNSLGNISHEYYDALDRKVLATSFGFKEAEATQHWVYNSDNQLAQQSNAYDATDVSNTPILTDYAYDNYNRPVSVKYNNVEMSNTSYRVLPVGYETTIITYIDIDLIDKKEVKKTTTLDPTGLTIIATDKGGTITYKYGSHNKLLETTSNGSTIYLTYNTQLKKISMTDPNTGTLLYDYNAFGELLGQTNAKGNDYSYSYDDLGRMTKKWGGQEVYTYTYNNTTGAAGIGQIHEEELKINGTSKHKKTHSYNANGLLIGVCEVVNGIPYNTNYSYDNYFRTTVIDYPNIAIRHHYYDHNNLEKITYANDSNNIIWQKTAEEIDGKPKTEIYGNGFENNYTYDAHRQLHTIQSINAGTQQTALDVEYNFELTSGNLMWRKYGSTSTNATTETFRYDQSDRLISIVEDNPIGRAANKVFEYEPNGNTKNITYNGLVQKLEYNNPKMPHALTDHKFDNTNPTVPMSSIDIHDYIYNRFDKIEDIKQDYGKYTMHIEYGIDQQRISMELVEYSDIVRRYYIGSAKMETKEVNDVEYENTYIYADGKPIAIHSLVYAPESQTEELYYLHTDYQGSLMAISKSYGYVAEYRNYDAWGHPRDCWTWDYSSGYFSYVGAATGLTLRGYTMHEHLEIFSLINMNGRLYDPVLGRMLSADNYIQSPDNSQSYNRYSYCVNNPLKYTDPNGQFWHLVIGAAIGGTINWLAHGAKFDSDGLKYFGVGAVAGALGAGVAAGMSSAMAGGSFGAGFLGTPVAMTVTSGFVSGATIGIGSGFCSGFITGVGNAAIENKTLNEIFNDGVRDGINGAIFGGIIGGTFGGIDASIDDRNFFTGELPKGGDNRIWGEIRIKANDGHSWLQLRNESNGEWDTYGTWGNRLENGEPAPSIFTKESLRKEFWKNYEGDKYNIAWHEYYSKITFAQKARFDNFINKAGNRNWSLIRNCSTFSRDAFNHTTGLHIMSHPFLMPVNTPKFFGRYLSIYGLY